MNEIKMSMRRVEYSQKYSLGDRDIEKFWNNINKDPRVKSGTDDFCYIGEYMITRPRKDKQYLEIISKSQNLANTNIDLLRERVRNEMEIVKGTIEKIIIGELTEIN